MMGDAWTALSNNDEYTLFYNPASLGGNYSVDFNPLNVRLSTTGVVDVDFSIDDGLGIDIDDSRFSNFPSTAAGISERLLGFPVYLEASTFPGLKMLHFAFNLFASSKTSMILRNSVHPSLELDYRYDRGFAAGFAYNLIGGLNSAGKKIASGTRLSLGYGLKYVRREGVKSKFDLLSTGVLSEVASAETAADIKNIFGFSSGKAFGHDLGLELSIGNGTSEWISGLSLLNVGDIRFKKLSGDENVPNQDMYLNFGTAFKQEMSMLDWGVSFDMKPINAPIPISRMLSLGAYADFPFLSLYGGLSQGYKSYGFSFDLFIFRADIGFYSVELENDFKEKEGKRMLLYLSFFDGNFDIF